MKIRFRMAIVLLFGFAISSSYAQSKMKIGDNPGIMNSSAVLELEGTKGGFLPPRMNLGERDDIASPVAGLMLWCTNCGTSGETQIYNGTAWTHMSGAAGASAQFGVTTNGEVSVSSSTSATGGGAVSGDGGNAITARGICWSTTTGPTTADFKTSEAGTTGSFISTLTSLVAQTTYYVRSYATTTVGNSYGTEVIFKMPVSAICDGSVPTTVVEIISPHTGKIWMDRNLGASRAGTGVFDEAAYGCLYQWGRGNDGHASVYWSSSTIGFPVNGTTTTLSNSDNPGDQLFIAANSDWSSNGSTNRWQGTSAVNNPCPSGFRIPSVADIENDFGADGYNITTIATAYSSLKLVAGGARLVSGEMYHVGVRGYYYTSDSSGANSAYNQSMAWYSIRQSVVKSEAHTVRCIKD